LRFLLRATSLLVVVLFTSLMARAQEVDAFVGLGSAHASSNGQQINTFGDGNLYPTSGIGGTFTDFGANVFFGKQFGVGWNGAWKFTSTDYAGLQYRISLHTFDGIYEPAHLRTRHLAPEIRAGLGFANLEFDYNDPVNCAQVHGCPGSHYFLGHGAGAVRWYLTNHIFLRPAVDVNYVYHFYPFGSHWIPRYSMNIGYSFGRE
jgi:hypothetical protein